MLTEGLYRTDVFHRQPLLAVRPPQHDPGKPPLLVRSWEEAFALHGRPRIDDINPAWIGRLVSGSLTASLAPYRRIHRLPRAHWVAVEASGHFCSAAYDPFAGGPGPLPEKQLYALIRNGLLSSLEQALKRYEGPIGCEHSSGLDSNAIVGGLRHGLAIPAERLHTLSDGTWGEGPLITAFQEFHGLRADQVHGWVSSASANGSTTDPALERLGMLHRFWAPDQVCISPSVLQPLIAVGAGVVFSGFGGDQALTHHGANVATDLVAAGRWRDLVQWKGGRRTAIRSVLGRGLALVSRPWATARVRHHYARNWCYQRWLPNALAPAGQTWLGPHLQEDYPLEMDLFLRQGESMRQRVLAEWVTVRAEEETRLAASCGVRKVFPLLNEPLIAAAIDQDPLAHARRAGKGRRIARRALAPFLPPYLRLTPGKLRPYADDAKEQMLTANRIQALALIAELQNEHHPLLEEWWPLASMLEQAERALRQPVAEPDASELLEGLLILHKLDYWLRWLEGGLRGGP